MTKINIKDLPDCSELFHRILNLEQGHAETREASREFVESVHAAYRDTCQSKVRDSEFDVDDAEWLVNKLTTWAVDWQSKRSISIRDADRDVVARFVTEQYAPIGLAPGSVLQNIANAANCHEPIAAHTHAAHAWHIGGFSFADNHSALYRQLLECTGQYLPKIESPTFIARANVTPASYTLAAYRLALSLFPMSSTPEILGSALFELCVPVSPLVDAALSQNEALHAHPYMLARHDASRINAHGHIERAIGIALDSAVENTSKIASRVALGLWTSMNLLDAWQDETACHIQSRLLDPTVGMIEVIRRKSRFAVGYHNRLKLADHPFDEYVVKDPEHFVEDLAHSRWIVPGKPDESLLLTRLTAFGGPMFRVFSEQEIAVIRAWIASLRADSCSAGAELSANITVTCAGEASAWACSIAQSRFIEQDPHPGNARHSRAKQVGARELYHRMLNHEAYPDVFDDAGVFAETWLARSFALSERGPNAIPFLRYTRERLRGWFENKALLQARSYAGPTHKIDKSREQVIDEAVQLCPMILVDGGWVQRWTNASHVDTNVGMLLWKIFSDEIGNGDPLLNHANIYRDLMRQMDVELPDFRTRAFAESDLFLDESFEVPAFWLSISQFPRRFLPETLGLNLAMELSGVGGAYRTARDELRHYRFDTSFVDLHNTIDNVSTGHSAMALEAIELHLDAALSTANGAAVDVLWRRVWTGFCALAIPRRTWKELFAKPTYPV